MTDRTNLGPPQALSNSLTTLLDNNSLGSKTLGTKCIKTSMCNVLANHYQNLKSRFRLFKVCLFVKLDLSELQDLLAKSASLDRSKIRLDRLNLVQINFLQIFSNTTQAQFDMQGFIFYSKYKKKNPSHILLKSPHYKSKLYNTFTKNN